VRPPSIERSSHTSSPGLPFSIEAQPIAASSSKCSLIVRPKSVAETGVRSFVASAGSRASQYLLQIVAWVDTVNSGTSGVVGVGGGAPRGAISRARLETIPPYITVLPGAVGRQRCHRR
jgi:hypothetical protein